MSAAANRIGKRRLRKGTGLETIIDRVAIAVLILGSIIALGWLLIS